MIRQTPASGRTADCGTNGGARCGVLAPDRTGKPPVRDGARQIGGSGTDRGRRPSRRALAGGFGPQVERGAVLHGGKGDGLCHGSGGWPFAPPGGKGKRPAFPPPARHGAPQTGTSGRDRGQRPPGAGRALAGGLWAPRRSCDERSAVAKAMAFAMAAGAGLSPLCDDAPVTGRFGPPGWPAPAGGGPRSAGHRDRGDGPCRQAQGARGCKCFPPCGPPAPAAAPSAACRKPGCRPCRDGCPGIRHADGGCL